MSSLETVASTKPSVDKARGLKIIAAFKLAKALLLLIVAIGAIALLGKDIEEILTNLVFTLRADPDNRIIHSIIAKLSGLTDKKLELISAGTFLYSGLLSTEGVGLMLRKRWAEYLTVIATALFIPLEIYEIFHHKSIGKFIILIVNVAMVVYLIKRIHYEKHQEI